MKAPRHSRKNRVAMLPGHCPEHELKVRVYRIDSQCKRLYLDIFPYWYFALGVVKSHFGGGECWYEAVYKGRILNSDGFLIEGTPKVVPDSSVRGSGPIRMPTFRNRR
ncbi:MAG: hypothetical protein CV089_03285 [Nitrospira sp. WS110]|nr:hypothetical protein [Nitrospira sp. WS110]